MSWKDRIDTAAKRIDPYCWQTPVHFSQILYSELGFPIFFKMENQQISGSFKSRGAYNKILSALENEKDPSFFITASTGNHAAGFGMALKKLNKEGLIFLPENVTESKLDFIRSLGIPWEIRGRNSLETELIARETAERQKWMLVPPYNDMEIIAGQGTVAREILQQVPDVEAVVVPVGGGGLVSGIAGYLKEIRPELDVIGCQPENSPEMYLSIRRGQILEEQVTRPTLSDGTAGGIEPGAITFDLCRQYVDDFILVSESEIAAAIRWMVENHQEIIEGAAALTIAAVKKMASRLEAKTTVLILTGKRLSYGTLKKIICR